MTKKNEGRLFPLFLAVGDASIVYAGFWLMLSIGEPMEAIQVDVANQLILMVSAGSILFFYLFDCYSDYRRKQFQPLFYSLIFAISAFTFFLFITTLWSETLFTNNVLLFTKACVTQVFLLSAFRYGAYFVAQQSLGKTRIVIITKNNESLMQLKKKFSNHSSGKFVVTDFLINESGDQLKKHILKNEAVVVDSSIKNELRNNVIQLCSEHNREILIVPELYDFYIQTAHIQQIDDMMVFSIAPAKQSNLQKGAKRVFDVVGALLLLLVSSPIILALCILIPLTSKGPAFYRQERIGLNGKPYAMYKFRSMKLHAEKETGPVLAGDNDPRISKIGHFIRATRLDELAQLVNVIRGEMSIVGPRPERDYFIQQFIKQVPDYNVRLSVKPGITGLAQVFGKYATSVEDKLRYDLMYIRDSSLMLDLKILLQTIRVVLQKNQAQGVVAHHKPSQNVQQLNALKFKMGNK
ncbi:sugar transferase [Fictibacillus nanhaiensis]|uniref:sugar transferase n=1 Tax=Fictibacillus nanhaiensis TaxID=742169 RepID=UPI001C976470|nr:sugar transferase [Fictibacillus nanhaiensis]MBY6037220.1 sugar transferase [Fictibacillus nanhaiensis]